MITLIAIGALLVLGTVIAIRIGYAMGYGDALDDLDIRIVIDEEE